MDWENEPYVRIYTRDTAAWVALPWQARAVFYELKRKVDRAGVLKLGRRGVNALPEFLRFPVDVVQVGINALLEEGTVVEGDGRVVIPDHLESEETERSDKARQRDSRERRLARALAAGATPAEARVAARPDRRSPSVAGDDAGSREVTPGHTGSREVTPGHSFLALPSLPSLPCLALQGVQGGDSAAAEPPARRKRKPTEIELPDEWGPSDGHRDLAVALGVDLDREVTAFRDHAHAHARRCVRWDAAFRTWLRKAGEFRSRGGRGPNGNAATAAQERFHAVRERVDLSDPEQERKEFMGHG